MALGRLCLAEQVSWSVSLSSVSLSVTQALIILTTMPHAGFQPEQAAGLSCLLACASAVPSTCVAMLLSIL